MQYWTSQTNPQDPNQVIKLLSHYIQYNGLIYVFHGVSSKADFDNYTRFFSQTARGFRKLTDRSKINVSPERLAIKTVPSGMTLQQALSRFNIPAKRHEEFAVVNGMELKDPLKAGDMIKVLR